MITSKYFKEEEFQSCTPSCSLQDMTQETMNRLDQARELAGMPLSINCAYRAREWDKAKGRSGNSAHTEGTAIDIRCNSSHARFKVIKALMDVGFNRIGIAKTFIHADTSVNLTQEVMFDYY